MTWSIRRTPLAAMALVLAAGFAAPASAQWAWKDDSGRTVYSDRPPPASIKSEQILRQPGPGSQGYGAPAQSAQSAQAGEGKDAAKGPKTMAEREQEFRKRQQENAEAEKKASEEQSRNEAKQAECERARGYLKALEDGQRIARTDAAGNREFLDDAARAKELARTREAMGKLCNG